MEFRKVIETLNKICLNNDCSTSKKCPLYNENGACRLSNFPNIGDVERIETFVEKWEREMNPTNKDKFEEVFGVKIVPYGESYVVGKGCLGGIAYYDLKDWLKGKYNNNKEID